MKAIGGLAALVLAGSIVGCASSQSQLKFGIDMAKRGLWNEALFRFEQAQKAEPNNPKALNDLAIAYEAVGRFDDALATYRTAIKLDPNNRSLRKNYTQFLEFYQGFKVQVSNP